MAITLETARRFRPRQRGLTLIEFVVSLTVLSVLMAVAVAGVLSAGSSEALTERGSRHTKNRLQLSTLLRRTLGQAKATALNVEGDSFTFCLPVTDAVGAHVDAAGSPLWGISDSQGDHVGGSCTIDFVVQRVLVEAIEERDINDDGDMQDSFDEGVLRRTTDTGEELPMPTPRLVQVTGDHGADVDGDGEDDRIFSLETNGALTLKMVFIAANGRLREHLCAILLADV